MKTSTLEKNGVLDGVVETISLIMDRIPWPERRLAMAEVTQHLLDGKPRVAEYVFGWSRESVKTGLEELRTGVTQVNDLSKRRKPKTEEEYPHSSRTFGLSWNRRVRRNLTCARRWPTPT